MAGGLYGLLTRKMDNVNWMRVTWVLAVSFASGWLAYLTPNLFILRNKTFFEYMVACRELLPKQEAVMVFSFTAVFASLGFVGFKKGFFLLLAFLVVWIGSSFAILLKGELWLPIGSVVFSSVAGYVGSQAGLAWRLRREWNVRSLSIKPLLELSRRSETDLRNVTFDEYLRSLWRELEEATGVSLKSTRVDENVSLVRNYLKLADFSRQDEDFIIIRNASDMSPCHRMLLPLPSWGEESRASREFAILAWDGNVARETLASLAALTLFAAVHFRTLEESRRRKEMLIKTIEAIMAAVDAKDAATSEHSRRVANLSRKLGEWMGLGEKEVEDIYFAGIIHDIGKLGISDNILKKSDFLTDEEFSEMQKHPLIGQDIMRPVDLSDFVVSGIRQHHERHDGGGYPSGIDGSRITVAAKIIKVADVFDALSHKRRYKDSWDPEEVRQFLLDRRGTEFDPQVVDVFMAHIGEI